MSAELVVIGGGPGGYAAAFHAADHGMNVTLIDMEKNPGGVCLYRGCIPSKALLHIAKLINEAEEAEHWGVKFGKPEIDIDKLRAFKNKVVNNLTGGLGTLSKQRKITYIQGRAEFISSDKLKIALNAGGTQELQFKNAIIAVGSEITTFPVFQVDSPRLLNSTSALDLPEIPESMLVIGGGYIGLELGSVYEALGTKVSVVEATPTLLPGADRDLVNFLAKKVNAKFEEVMLSSKVVKLDPLADGINVHIETPGGEVKVKKYSYVLLSIGRRPNAKGIGLENTKVTVNQRGFIEVDPQRRTKDPGIFAIGDIAGDPMLAHKASAEAKVAVEAIKGSRNIFAPMAIPAVVFTDPEIAWAGITETEAKEKNIPHEVAKFPWAASGRAQTLDRNDGVTKIIVDPKTERILGVGLCGPGAGEMIAEAVLAIEMGANVRDLALTIHPHPTLSETIMEAAESFFGHATHIYRPKKK